MCVWFYKPTKHSGCYTQVYIISQPWTKTFVKIYFPQLLSSAKDFSLSFFCFWNSGEVLKEASKHFIIIVVIIVIIIVITKCKFVWAFYDSNDWIKLCVTAFEQPYFTNDHFWFVNCLTCLCNQLDFCNQCFFFCWLGVLATMRMKLQFPKARLAHRSREVNHVTGDSDFLR